VSASYAEKLLLNQLEVSPILYPPIDTMSAETAGEAHSDRQECLPKTHLLVVHAQSSVDITMSHQLL
jgi:hypothetical protein